jgi:hypothetical protein
MESLTEMWSPALRVTAEPEVLLTTFASTLIDPELSTRALPCVIAVTRSLLRIVAVPEVVDWNTPSMNAPVVGPELLMLTVDGIGVGVTSTVAPTYASEVTAKLCVVVIPVWNPSPVKVATPAESVVAVTEPEVTFVPSEVSTAPLAADRVTVCPACAAFPLASFTRTTIGSENVEPARDALGV